MATESQPSFSVARRWKIGFDVVVRTLLVLTVLVLINYLGAQFFKRFYISAQTRTELSPRTLSVVHSLTNDVTVTLYYDKTDEMFPTIVALLNEYRAANPKITVKAVDYTRDAGEAQKVKEKYKLSSATDKDLVIFDCEGRVKVANGDALSQYTVEEVPNAKEREFRRKPILFRGEQMFTTLLLAVQNPQPFKAYFLQGHGEPALNDNSDQGYMKFGAILAQNYIATQPLQLLGDTTIPDDCNLLIIAGPRTEFRESELQKIDQYLSQGGRLFMLFDYFSVNKPTGLESILARWGVEVGSDTVQDPDNFATRGQDVIIRQFSKHPVVNPLTQLALQLILPRPIAAINWQNPPADAPQVENLIASGPNSTLANSPGLPPRSYPLMIAVEQKPVAGVASPRGTTRMVVTGDSFFLNNRQIESGANRDFLGYAANWLLDRSVLLDGVGPRPVTEFRLLLTDAQQRQIRWLLLGALPGGVLLFGWFIWLLRRK